MLAILLPFTARAQWLPDGVKVATGLSTLISAPPVPVLDGLGGAVFAADELAKPDPPRGSVARVRADGTLPAGWPAAGVPPAFLSFGTTSDGAGGAYVGRLTTEPMPSLVVFHVLASGALDPAWPPAGRVVADSAAGFHGMQLLADGSGGLYAFSDVTSTNESGVYDGRLRALRLQSNGAPAPGWSEGGVLLARAPFVQRQGRAFVSSAGVILYGEWEANGPAPFPNGPRTPYVVGLTPNGGVLPGWTSYSMPVPLTATGDAVQLVPDGSGGAFYAVTPLNAHRTTIQHLRVSGTLDPVWPAGGVALVADTSALAQMSVIAHDGAEGCFAFGLRVEGPVPGVERSSLLHLQADGAPAPGWPVELAAEWNTQGQLPEGRLAIVPDGRGGAFLHELEQIIFGPFESGFRRLRVQHFAHTGQVAAYWPAEGRVFAAQPGIRRSMSAISDGHGGVLVSWLDNRADTAAFATVDLYALGIGPDGSFTTGVSPVPAVGVKMSASPVPAFGESRLSFALPARAHVSLAVFDVGGRRVRRLHEGALEAGPHTMAWDGRDEAGRPMPQGVYLARATMNGVASDTRIVRLR